MKYQDIPIQNAIETMKERISSSQMSLLVGSGVSCCAFDFYQNWVGLVTDMVAALYTEELERKGIEVKQIGGRGFGWTNFGWGLRLRLDHILYSDELELVDVKVIDSDLSDHKPLMARFRLK